jgi:hypothetical protein
MVKTPAKSARKRSARAAASPAVKTVEQLSTALLAELHHRIQDWILSYLENFADPASLDLREPLPKPVNKPGVMASLVGGFRQEIENPSWHVDPANFSLGGPELWSATQGKSLSYLVQYVFQKAQRALR